VDRLVSDDGDFEYPKRSKNVIGGLQFVAKHSKSILPAEAVRTRRAYFDCRFGQLHVRTAFPATGGFDEQVPLFCLHSDQSSSRTFATFLSEIADVRSVYAPDLPGLGESDPSPASTVDDAAGAVSDLADDLRLRQIDLLGLYLGARVSLDLAAARPTLVRRLVLVGVPAANPLPAVKQQTLIMRTRLESPDDIAKLKTVMPNSKFVDIEDYANDLFAAAPKTLAKQIGTFLTG
jgi:pimeloyl-ACP methyl ester carboxylesterase